MTEKEIYENYFVYCLQKVLDGFGATITADPDVVECQAEADSPEVGTKQWFDSQWSQPAPKIKISIPGSAPFYYEDAVARKSKLP